jgi:hypothetical protein
LNNDSKNDVWTEHQDELMIVAHEKYGNKWRKVCEEVPDKTF